MSTALDLDVVREVLAPLDLSLLFAVVGGDHLYGLAAPDSEVRVRAGHRDALSASLGPGRRAANLELELLQKGLGIKLLSEDLDRVGRRVEHATGPLFEELHSPLVLVGEDAANELRELSKGFLTRKVHRYYHSLARSALWRLEGEKTKRTRPILWLYRAALAGIHVLETGEVQPDLERLLAIYELPHVEPLLPSADGPTTVGDPARAAALLNEAYDLLERLDRAAEGTSLPDEPADPAPLRDWLASRRSVATE